MTKPKRVQFCMEFASIFKQDQWLVEIVINGFTSKRPIANRNLMNKIQAAVKQYNKRTL